MRQSRLLSTVRYLGHAMAVVSVPAEATAAVDKGAAKASFAFNEASYRLIDFFTLELVLLGGLVLIAFVLIARKPKSG
ncbi:MAG: hypothetical protein U9P00_12895 [Pseudomonadota bacterium]|nr:hypothetical protein [Pseudomonadota bacterium]